MLHRVIFGSMERFHGILIEHYAGAFPLWLAPTQVNIVPISNEKHADFAQKVYSPNNQESVRYGMFFSSVLVAWESEQKALKVMNKQMPVNDAQAGAVKNLPPKVIGEVNNRKHSASVNNKNTMKNAGKTRSKSTVIKSKPPGI